MSSLRATKLIAESDVRDGFDALARPFPRDRLSKWPSSRKNSLERLEVSASKLLRCLEPLEVDVTLEETPI